MKNKKGFTLIEVLLAVLLIGVASMLMYSFFGQGLNLYTLESESAERQANIRQIMSDITNKARLTEPENITYETGTLNIGDYAYTFSGGQVLRDGTAIAKDISSFVVTIDSGILEVDITNTSGDRLTTSISLLE